MPYLVDSDWVIDHLANVPEAVQLLDRLAQDGIAISIITYMEAFQYNLTLITRNTEDYVDILDLKLYQPS